MIWYFFSFKFEVQVKGKQFSLLKKCVCLTANFINISLFFSRRTTETSRPNRGHKPDWGLCDLDLETSKRGRRVKGHWIQHRVPRHETWNLAEGGIRWRGNHRLDTEQASGWLGIRVPCDSREPARWKCRPGDRHHNQTSEVCLWVLQLYPSQAHVF